MLMDKLRSASNGIVWKIVFSLISLSFILSGIAGYIFSHTDTHAVKVNGEEISQQEFQQGYNNLYEQESRNQGTKFDALADSPEYLDGLRKQVVNNLIDQALLRQYIKELNLAVSDAQITHEIALSPLFQVNGKFDNNAYLQFLRNNGLTSESYVEYLREGFSLQQLESGLGDSEFIVPAQQQAVEKLLFQQRGIRIASISLEQEISKQVVSEEEINSFYEANKSSFVTPEQVKLQYLDLTQESATKGTEISDVEISQYYQDNKSQFITQEQKQVAHIQFANEKDALDTYQALQNGADFATLAKEKSMDQLSANNGGDLGWVNAADLPPAFSEVMNTLNINQYSQPVKIDANYHIVKLIAQKESEVLSLDKVKSQIAQQIRQERQNNQFYKVEKIMAEKSFEDPTGLKTAAEATGLSIKETDYFSHDNIPTELDYPAIIRASFDESKVGLNSEPMNIGEQHSIVIRVLDYKPTATKSLEETKTDIEKQLKRQKAENAVFEKAQKIVLDLNDQNKSVTELNFSANETWNYLDKKDPLLRNAIFSMHLKGNQPSYKAVKDSTGTIAIIELNSIIQKDPNERESALLNATVLQVKKQDLQLNLLKALRAKAKIEINEAFINQAE